MMKHGLPVEVEQAGYDLRYLLNRGYQRKSLRGLLKLVGDRYGLDAHQRNILARTVYPDGEALKRRVKLVGPEDIVGCALGVDGYNVLVTIESAFRQELLLLGDDGLVRDVAGQSSSYRPGPYTMPALNVVLQVLRAHPPQETVMLFDARMSRSGELSRIATNLLQTAGLNGGATTSPYPDKELLQYQVVASSDSGLVDASARTFDLAGYVATQTLGLEPIRLSGCTTR